MCYIGQSKLCLGLPLLKKMSSKTFMTMSDRVWSCVRLTKLTSGKDNKIPN